MHSSRKKYNYNLPTARHRLSTNNDCVMYFAKYSYTSRSRQPNEPLLRGSCFPCHESHGSLARRLFGPSVCRPLPNRMYFETNFKLFKMYFQYLNTIFLYFNPIWQKSLNFRPCLKYILSVVQLYLIKRKTSLINLQCILFNKYD